MTTLHGSMHRPSRRAPASGSRPYRTRRAHRPGPRAAFRLCAIAAIIGMSGCSFMFVRPAPPAHAWNVVSWSQCTRSRFWPVIDTIMTLSSAVQIASPQMFTPDPDLTGSGTESDTMQLTVGLLTTAAWAASTYYGFSSTSRCSAYVYRQMQLQRGYPAGYPQGYPPGQPGYAPQGGAPVAPQQPPATQPPADQPPATQPPGQEPPPLQPPAPAPGTP